MEHVLGFSHNTSLLLYALIAVIALIVLIARFKFNPFVVLIMVSLATGLAAGMPLGGVVKAFQDGVGGSLGFIAVVVGLGTMLGKLMAESGAPSASRRRSSASSASRASTGRSCSSPSSSASRSSSRWASSS